MTQAVQDIAHRALELTPSERAQLAHRLIESLDLDHDEDAEARWVEEIERRREDIETGRVVCKPIGEALRNTREKLKDARSQSPEGK